MQDQKVTKYRMTTTPSTPGAVVDKKESSVKPVDKAKEYIKQISEKVKEAQNILVALSRDPSVDDMSAAIGLTLFLDMFSKHTTAIYSGQTPDALEFLKPEGTFEDNTDSLQDFIIALSKDKADHLRYRLDGDFVKVYITPYKTRITEEDLQFSYGDFNIDLVIALNVPTAGDLDEALAEHGRIMHDATTINMTTGKPGKFAEIEWSDPRASSVSEMAARLIMNLNGESKNLDSEVATALLTGIVAATGRFSNERTTSLTLELASKLMMSGADQQLISANVVDNIVGTGLALSEDEVKPKPKKQLKLTNEKNEPVLPKVVEPAPEVVSVNVVPKAEIPPAEEVVKVNVPPAAEKPVENVQPQVEAAVPQSVPAEAVNVQPQVEGVAPQVIEPQLQPQPSESEMPVVEKSANIAEMGYPAQEPNMYTAPPTMSMESKDYGAMLEQALNEPGPASPQFAYNSYYDNIPQYAQGAQAGAYNNYYGYGQGQNQNANVMQGYDSYNNGYGYVDATMGQSANVDNVSAPVASNDANAALSAFLASNGALGASEAMAGGYSGNVTSAGISNNNVSTNNVGSGLAGLQASMVQNGVASSNDTGAMNSVASSNPAVTQAPAVAEVTDDVGQFKIPNAYPVGEVEAELPPTMPREMASQLKSNNVAVTQNAEPVSNAGALGVNLPPAPAPTVAGMMLPGMAQTQSAQSSAAGFNPAAAAAPQINENQNDAGSFKIPGF